jgi:predicted DNA-binding protein with PD1-like motif
VRVSGPPSHPRMLRHPGAVDHVRIHMGADEEARHFRVRMRPGESMHDALVKALSEVGAHAASMTILGGELVSAQYCVAPPDPKGQTVIAYGAPIEAGHTYLVFGNATLGLSDDGRPLVHCHAVLRTAAGAVVGGHLLTERCTVGDEPPTVLATTFSHFAIRQAADSETGLRLFVPATEVQHG